MDYLPCQCGNNTPLRCDTDSGCSPVPIFLASMVSVGKVPVKNVTPSPMLVGGDRNGKRSLKTTYTATFTGAANTDISNGSVSVDSTWHEANGNPGTGATTAAFVVDTVTPTVAVAINSTMPR
jgi:hypothetical protein